MLASKLMLKVIPFRALKSEQDNVKMMVAKARLSNMIGLIKGVDACLLKALVNIPNQLSG